MGALLRDASGTIFTGPGGGAIGRVEEEVGDLDVLTIEDLTYVGAYQLSQHTFTTGAMAVRWRDSGGTPVFGREPTASDVRHFLFYSTNGHVIEYKEVSAPSTSAPTVSSGSYAGIPSLTETRRWYNWSNYSVVFAAFPSAVGNGMTPSMFRWEPGTTADNGRLWYAWTPNYGDGVLANMQYVVLDDDEARAAGVSTGVEVSAGNRSSYAYFKAVSASHWKDGTQGVAKIPADRQADFGGMENITAGGNTSLINDGAKGVSFWTVPAYPTAAHAAGDSIWTTATHIYETGASSGVNPSHTWRPANITSNGGNTIVASMYWVTAGGSYSTLPYDTLSPKPLGLNVGDCLYFYGYGETGTCDVINVRMTTPASGGSCVIERYNGSAWVEPADLTVHAGSRAMDATHNVFYFDTVTSSVVQPHASMPVVGGQRWWRLRRTVAGSTGGHVYGVYCTVSNVPGATGAGTTRPEAVGGYIDDHADAVAAYNADPTASHAFAYAPDYVDGTCFVRTNAVEGVMCAGKFSTRTAWYGQSPFWVRPDNITGAPYMLVDSVTPENSNGNWCEGAYVWYFFVFNVDHLVEAYNFPGTRSRDSAGIRPVAYYHVREHFSLPTDRVSAVGSTDYPAANDRQEHFGQAMDFCQVHKQVLYLNSRGGGTYPLLQIWDVRDS
jgi:hypothetical protein